MSSNSFLAQLYSAKFVNVLTTRYTHYNSSVIPLFGIGILPLLNHITSRKTLNVFSLSLCERL